jgi:hypothetical protein
MLGFGDKQERIDPTKLPVFVHAIQNAESFSLIQNVWTNNNRYIILDPTNNKELMRFVFSKPNCVVWLERDRGRTDTYELILIWEGESGASSITEVYVISSTEGYSVGDDTRIKSLLNAILTSPSIVPVNPDRIK